MLLIALLAVAAAVTFGLRRKWRWARWLSRRWDQVAKPAWAWMRAAPVTYSYLLLLSFTTWLLFKTDPRVRDAFLEAQSTNLHQMQINPMPVLARSAFYVTPLELALWWVMFTLILAPLERWIGSARWFLGFWTGHIVASLLVGAGIYWGVLRGRLERDIAFDIDTGASYGFACLLAVATFWFRTRGRWLWSLGWLAFWGTLAALWPNQTNIGHLTAYLVGFGLFPLVYHFPAREHVFFIPESRRLTVPPSSRDPHRSQRGGATAVR